MDSVTKTMPFDRWHFNRASRSSGRLMSRAPVTERFYGIKFRRDIVCATCEFGANTEIGAIGGTRPSPANRDYLSLLVPVSTFWSTVGRRPTRTENVYTFESDVISLFRVF